MRAFILTVLILSLTIGFAKPCFSQDDSNPEFFSLPEAKQSQSYSLESSKRYIKLAMTYREAGDLHSSKMYLEKALERLKYSGDNYWRATVYEFLAYVYHDLGQPFKAIRHLERAKRIYDKLIDQNDGSPFATNLVIVKYEDEIYNEDIENEEKKEYVKEQVKKLLEELDKIQKEIDNLTSSTN